MCEYTSMFEGKKSENLKSYNGRGSLERAYNTASGTAAKKQNGITGSVWRNCQLIFKNVAVFAKLRQSLRIGAHNSKSGQLILWIAFGIIDFSVDKTIQITVGSIRQTAMIDFLYLRQAIRFYDIQACPLPLRPALFTEYSRGQYGKTPTIQPCAGLIH